jgi:small subunit ribosomal protein S7
MSETKAAPAGKAPEKKSGKKGATTSKKKYVNPFSFGDPLQAKFVSSIMKNGKKTVAQKILKDTFDEMNRKGEDDPLKAFEKAIDNVTPSVEVKPKRIGGAVYQIPMPVTPKRQKTLPVRWILAAARKKKGQPMFKRLASELIDAANETGAAFSQKEEVHRMAQANKAFAHLARY